MKKLKYPKDRFSSNKTYQARWEINSQYSISKEGRYFRATLIINSSAIIFLVNPDFPVRRLPTPRDVHQWSIMNSDLADVYVDHCAIGAQIISKSFQLG